MCLPTQKSPYNNDTISKPAPQRQNIILREKCEIPLFEHVFLDKNTRI